MATSFYLLQLEQHSVPLGIRDEKFVLSRILPEGRCSLSSIISSNELKYIEKTATDNKEETLTDYSRAAYLAQEKFNIKITPDELRKCCTSNINSKGLLFFDRKPKQPWTVEFPLDEHTILSMRNNLE